MSELDYPDREAHFHEHSNLIAELQDLQRQFKAGTLCALAMPIFLQKWLQDHIQHTDMRYVKQLRANGITWPFCDL